MLHSHLVTPNHWLVTQTANEHELKRHAATVRQLSDGTYGIDLFIHIATVDTFQTVNSSMHGCMHEYSW